MKVYIVTEDRKYLGIFTKLSYAFNSIRLTHSSSGLGGLIAFSITDNCHSYFFEGLSNKVFDIHIEEPKEYTDHL